MTRQSISASLLVWVLGAWILSAQVPGTPGTTQPGQPSPAQPTGSRGTGAPRTGTGMIRGRVVSETGAVLRRAQVRLVASASVPGPPVVSILVLADEQGRFEFKALPSGRYTLSASKAGYLGLSYGQRRSTDGARPIELAEAQLLEGINLTLPKGAVVSVRVTDEDGEAVAGARVQLMRYRYVDGERQLAAAVGGGLATTNDLGIQRIAGVAPGDYLVSAGPSPVGSAVDERGLSFGATYYPGSLSVADAQRVTVVAGQEFTLAMPILSVRPARVSGVVRRADESAPVDPLVTLTYRTVSGGGSRNMFARPDGTFSLSNVLPGDYTIDAQPSGILPTATQEYVSFPIRVTGEDLTDLVVTTSPGGNLRGRIVFEGGPPPPTLSPAMVQVIVNFLPGKGTGSFRPKSNDDWTFELDHLIGSGVIGVRPVAGWYLKEVSLDGRDAIDTPVEFAVGKDVTNVDIVLTQTTTTITGTVSDARGQAASDYAVVVFAEDRERWVPRSRFIAAGRPDQEGRFKITGLPPGRYLAAAVDNLEVGEERDPELLTKLQSGAERVTLGEGQSQTLSLRLR